VDRTYAALKDLAEERRLKLLERCDLFRLLQEINDLEQWIAQREVVAMSTETGQDFDHVVVSSLNDLNFKIKQVSDERAVS